MMDSIYDNIPFDYGIYDPQVSPPPTEGSENTGNTINVLGSQLTITFANNTNVIEPQGDTLTLTIQ